MIPIAERKTLYFGECWHECIENLRCGRDLPVDMTATDCHSKGVDFVPFAAIGRQKDVFLIETKDGGIKPEVFCSAYKLQEVWDGKDKLVVKPNIEHLEEGGIDSSEKTF